MYKFNSDEYGKVVITLVKNVEADYDNKLEYLVLITGMNRAEENKYWIDEFIEDYNAEGLKYLNAVDGILSRKSVDELLEIACYCTMVCKSDIYDSEIKAGADLLLARIRNKHLRNSYNAVYIQTLEFCSWGDDVYDTDIPF